MSVARESEWTVIRTSDLTIEADRAAVPEDSLQGLLVVGMFIPSVRWAGNLEGLELIEPERSGALVRDAVAATVDDSLTTLPAFVQIAPLVSGDAEVLTRQSDGILGVVTGLDGAELRAGEERPFRDVPTSATGVSLVLEGALRLGDVCPCDEVSSALCRRLEIRSTYDVGALQAAVGAAASVRTLETTHRLVVEPATLLPYRIEGEKRTVMAVRSGEREIVMTDTESTLWTFHWQSVRGS